MRALPSQAVERRIPVIPVLLPGAPQSPSFRRFSGSSSGPTCAAAGRRPPSTAWPNGIRRRRPEEPRPDPLDRYRAWAAARYA
ncbi:MAG TPA: hypothetical protein VFE33_36070 [Thermoanaerobaculia bacterium]|nr:hypothetical protein [Thermoanaerobaculia bacterium]